MSGAEGAIRIPAVRLDNAEVWDAVAPRLRELVRSGRFILGPELEAFERAAAETFAVPWAVGVSNGTSAVTLALRASPLGEGARVALPANTFFADLEAVLMAGMVPVVVDNDADYLMSLEDLADIEVDAVMPVHLYGLPVDMPALMALARVRGWWVLEDCSQSHGATIGGRSAGSFGHAGAWSCYPTKNLGGWGDAGFVTGSDPDMAEEVRSLRHHAQRAGNLHVDIGGTERLDNLQALVLLEKLSRLRGEVEARRNVASWYREELADLGLELPDDRGDRRHAFHLFVVRVPDRDGVRVRMAERGIGTGIHYPTPIHQQPGAAGKADVPRTPKRAEEWSSQILSLPMYPTLTRDEVGQVAEALRASLP
jgi:dTDP-4-amino-4,6-dideoxygalactose transaminase